MGISVGSKLGPYEVIQAIGAGGFGQVYKARDNRLNRFVAIKVLPDHLSHNPTLKERFEREAQTLAKLSHPRICPVFDFGEESGMDFIVMEFLEGQTLAERLQKGALPLDDALKIAFDIADALSAAHQAGIIHRDLKPGNVMLTKSGPKLLDFGLAKNLSVAAAIVSAPDAPTAVPTLTVEGTILGTLQYMAPEQIEGQEADARSDIFSFGAVIYEMVTGILPFTGRSQTSLIAAILKEDPPSLQTRQPLTPAALDSVVKTCLEKDPDKRWQSAREVQHALTWIAAQAAAPAQKVVKSPILLRALAALMTLIAIGMAGWIFWPKPQGAVNRFEALLPEDVTPGESVSVSPDGRRLAFNAVGSNGLWVRAFESPEWRPLPGTESATSAFWSPDNKRLAFATTDQIKKVDIAGGPPETLCTVPGDIRSGAGDWNRDGILIFGSWGGGSGGPIWKVSESGGVATAVTQVDAAKGEFYHTSPEFLPDGKHFLYFRSGPSEVAGIYVGFLDSKPEAQSRERVLATSLPATYANGYLFFLRQRTLMAQPFDIRRLQLQGAPVPITEVQTTWYNTGVVSISPGGALAYRPPAVSGGTQLTWIDRQGKILSTFGPPGTDSIVSVSPDGKRGIAKDSPYNVQGDLWALDFSSGLRTRLTIRKNVYSPAVWSHDGTRLAYAAGNFGDTLYEKASSGVGDETELLKEPGVRHFPTSWSSDGRFLLYHTENAPKTGYDVWVLPLQGDRKPVLLLGEAYNEWAGVFSPDMHWIAYASLETHFVDVYVRPFLVSAQTGNPSLGEGKWQVSKNGGNWPDWRNSGEILFNGVPIDSTVFAAPVKTTGAVFESGAPERLFANPNVSFSIATDGQRFLLVSPQIQRSAPGSINIVLNWPALMKK
jgi:serine/threonine protein kinase/Tol biopolymer transport system component